MERFYLDQFIRVADFRPERVEERESPDFLLLLSGRRIGVEISGLYIDPTGGPESLQAEESLGTRLVSRARELYLKLDGRPCLTHILFSSAGELAAANREECARMLAEFLVKEAPAEGMRARFDWDQLSGRVPDFIQSVHALGVPEHQLGRWDIPRAGWVHSLTTEIVQSAISSKSSKLCRYLEGADDVWLLLVADRLYPSQKLEFDSSFATDLIRSPFGMTFLFTPVESQWVQIQKTGW